MTLTFDQIAEDYMDFNYYYYWSNPDKKEDRIVKSLLPLIFFVLLVLATKGMNVQQYGWAEINLLAFGLLMAAAMGWFVKWNNKRKIKSLIASGKNIDIVGRRTLQLEEERLIAQTESSKTEIRWSAFEKVRETKDHFFLFVQVHQAIVVPKRVLNSPEEVNFFRDFVFHKIR
jgi:hypothetical protein